MGASSAVDMAAHAPIEVALSCRQVSTGEAKTSPQRGPSQKPITWIRSLAMRRSENA